MLKNKLFTLGIIFLLWTALYFSLFFYVSRHYINPISVQILRKADKSKSLHPFVVEIRWDLASIFGLQNTKKVLKKTKSVTKEVAITAEYSFAVAFVMLGMLFMSLNMLVYRSRWSRYKVQKGDTLENILSQFTMVESSLVRLNPLLRTLPRTEGYMVLPVGMVITVRNRHFIERDYLDQLKYVLKSNSSHFWQKNK